MSNPRYYISDYDIMDEMSPLRDTDITDRLNEQDETIDQLRAELARRNDDVLALRAERDELLIRLAEYRSVNEMATMALEMYAATFGPLSA